MKLTEIRKRLKGCWNILTNNHPMLKQPSNNCPCYDIYGNQIGWWSRSNAAVCAIFCRDRRGNWYVLASQRGEGTPDPEFRGCWNLVTGYLDCNETLGGVNDYNKLATPFDDKNIIPSEWDYKKSACWRECYEETGIIIDQPIHFVGYNDCPFGDKRQNISFRFYTVLEKSVDFYQKQFSHKNNEMNEVGEISFIPLKNIKDYRWAFKHDDIVLGVSEFLKISNNQK